MKRAKRGISNFARTRQALLACFLGLGFAALWPGVALATFSSQVGPQGIVDSATDDGGGRIRISWSLESEPPEGYRFSYTTPTKVCVHWGVMENGEVRSPTRTCFTSEASNQSDLVVDTGIGADGPTTVFGVILVPYYWNNPMWPEKDGIRVSTNVTLNATTS
ncbi:MAG: hypothetical protein OXQ29_23495 [Rhodospirillaceae bacterium]|nr:hypothetical protein [Rhodospirillaceae bacterium]